MALDSYKIRENKKINEDESLDFATLDERMAKTKRMIDSLPQLDEQPTRQGDIDQQWVKVHESDEFRHFLHRDESPVKEEEEEIVIPKEEPLMQHDESPVTPIKEESVGPVSPESAPSVQPVVEEPLISEPTVSKEIGENPEIVNLKGKIIRKIAFLDKQIANIYKSPLLLADIQSICGDLANNLELENKSLEELQKIDKEIDGIYHRFALLQQRAEELKAKDEFKINQQLNWQRLLDDYQAKLRNQYGKYWFGTMSKEEREHYVQLYSNAHNVSRESVEKSIEDSINKAYEEVRAERNAKRQSNQAEEFKGYYAEMIKYNIRQGVDMLKEVYAHIQEATPEQIQEFNYLYNALSTLSKERPKNDLEDQKKLSDSRDLYDRIEQLKSSLSLNNIAR